MENVTVMMSAWNGEKYIREQIESILSQKDVNVNLIIRDDGSSDHTLDIAREFESRGVEVLPGENMGYAASFLNVLKIAPDSGYYAFADQDDVWDDDKLISAVKALKSSGDDLYASALQVVDANLNDMYIKSYHDYPNTIGSIFSRNRFAGCTMVFDRYLRSKIIQDLQDILTFNKENIGYGHDAWMMLYAMLYGNGVYVDNTPHIRYRRHGGTASSQSAGITKRIKKEFERFINTNDKPARISQFLLDHEQSHADPKNEEVLQWIAGYKHTPKDKTKMLITDKLHTGSVPIDLLNDVAILFNRY